MTGGSAVGPSGAAASAYPGGAGILSETPVEGAVPRFEVPGWLERYGVVAGITGRRAPDGTDFDLGLWSVAPVRGAMERWRAFRRAENRCRSVVMAHQVHGAEVAVHSTAPAAQPSWTILDGVDGHVTRIPGTLLAVTIADCIPVYLAARAQKAVALLHAGWRGTAAGILARGVAALGDLGASPESLVMHCGVGICGACYEVGAEVVHGCGEEPLGSGPWHVDLRDVLRRQAAALGIGSVTSSGWCSSHHGDRFFSHRGSGGADGRMVAYLGVPSPD